MEGVVRSIDAKVLEEARRLREEIHRNPELSRCEHQTAKLVADTLRRYKFDEVKTGLAGTGVLGLLKGHKRGSTVALRAEMDALPVQEKTGLPYASQIPGRMHACGHDGHVAILLGAARVLSGMRDRFTGHIKFVFQPAEEAFGGARQLVCEGLLKDSPTISAIFALHGRPQIDLGQIELDEVPNAASNAFEIRIRGKGAHAAYPHNGVDPITIGCQVVSCLQQIVSRQVAPYQAAVVTVGSFRAGEQGNVIPEEAVLKGTIRTRDPRVNKQAVASVRRIAKGCSQALGAKAQVRIEIGYPRVRNHRGLMGLVRQVGVELLGERNVLDAKDATMGAEDFAFYLEEQGGVPGCMFRLGLATNVPVHTGDFDFGHEPLECGILMMSNVALRFLANPKAWIQENP